MIYETLADLSLALGYFSVFAVLVHAGHVTARAWRSRPRVQRGE